MKDNKDKSPFEIQYELRSRLSHHKQNGYFTIYVDRDTNTITATGTSFTQYFFHDLSKACDDFSFTFSVTYIPHMVVINIYAR